MKRKERPISEAGEKLPGLSGAVFGAIFGSVPFGLVMALLGRRSMYASPLALLVPLASVFFYIALKGLRRKGWALGCVAFTSISSVMLAQFVAQSWILSRDELCVEAAAQYGVTPFEMASSALSAPENLKALLPSMLFVSLIVVAGLCFTWSKLAAYADLDKKGVAQIKARESEERLEELREEDEKNAEKKKKRPQRLERFGTDPDAPIAPAGEYRVTPMKMQKQYINGLGVAVIAVFAALAGLAVYKGAAAGSVRKALYALPALLMVYEGFSVMRSISRYIDVKDSRLVYRPSFGKKRSFSFDDIGTVRKIDGRCLVDGKRGEPLAFFNLGWENGKKLLTAMEDYKLRIVTESYGDSKSRRR